MVEINESRYQLEQNDKIYILSTSLIENRLKLVCQDSNSQIYIGEFTMNDLIKLSKYFQPTHKIDQIQCYLNGIIEKQRIGIFQNGTSLSLILFLINNDKISIPLIKKIENNNAYNYNNYNNGYTLDAALNKRQQKSNIASASSNNYYNLTNIDNNIPTNYPNQAQQKYYINSQPNGLPNQNIQNISTVYETQIEDNTNIIREGQEQLNDMKRLLEEASKYKEENQIYKTNHDNLIKENDNLKNENNNYKEQMLAYQNEYKGLEEENSSLRNQIDLLNKDVNALDNQNDEIRKMYENLVNENNLYKKQIDDLNKENESLKEEVKLLNNNFILINNELENIKNENNKARNNIEEQNNNNDQEIINKLIEENNLYKKKIEENELLKKEIEELQKNLQINQERQIEDDQEQENEVSGEIIHDIKELEMITKKINKEEDKKLIINLLYKASVDSDKAEIFHEKCDQAQNTIVLVETKDGKRFGGFTTCSWSGNCVDKNDPKAFIFSFDKMKTYDNIPGDEAIGCYPKFGPIFLGCQIKIFDNAFTKGGTTFEKELNFNTEEDYELTGGNRTFEVKEIEVYEVIIE